MAFCHLQEILEISMAKTSWILQQKLGEDAAKTTSKRVFQKTAEATGHLIGNKITEKITSLGK